MNTIIYMKHAMGDKELLNQERTLPITLSERIQIQQKAIKSHEKWQAYMQAQHTQGLVSKKALDVTTDFLNRKRDALDMLFEEQKAQEIAAPLVEMLLANVRALDVAYSQQDVRRQWFIQKAHDMGVAE